MNKLSSFKPKLKKKKLSNHTDIAKNEFKNIVSKSSCNEFYKLSNRNKEFCNKVYCPNVQPLQN